APVVAGQAIGGSTGVLLAPLSSSLLSSIQIRQPTMEQLQSSPQAPVIVGGSTGCNRSTGSAEAHCHYAER
ncbi:Hypothetical predicted protein, partial [Olea europaea subsp. europaea]